MNTDPLPPPRVVTAERWLFLGVTLGVGLAMAVALASFLAILRLQEDGARVAQTQEVIGALEGVLTTAAEAEAAALNYVTLGDADFLRLYDDAARDLNANLGRVGRLVTSPEQVRRLPVLAILSEQRMAHLAVLLEVRRREGFGAAQEGIAQRDQERLHQAIRGLVSDLKAAERGLLQKRLSNSERSASVALTTVGLGSLLSIGLTGLGLYWIRRGLADSRRAQAALETTNTALDRRFAERTAEWHASRELLGQIIDSAPSAIFAMDRSHRYTSTNAAHLQICGKPADLVLGRTEREVFAGATADRLWADNEELMEQGLTRQFEQELLREDGSTSIVISTKFPLRNAQGEVAGLGGVTTDITARREAEEAIRTLNAELEQRVTRRTAEAVAANAAKSRFLAHMSHEIRTPMNAMLGLTQVLEADTLAPAQRQIVQRIRSAGRSLLGIINDILDFSKIEAGQIRVETWPFEPAPLFAQVESLMGEMARAKGLGFRIETPPDLAPRVLGDPLRLEQVLVNLVGNAVKFTERGEVQVRVRQQETPAAAVRLHFEVTDTGIGIAPADLGTLGRPFFQTDATITRRFGGTGLGLTISKHLVELMGGTFGCESTLGVGSRFWFELSCARAAGEESRTLPATPAADPTGPRLHGLHYLVVDDSDMNRDLLERALGREGARVTLAADGRQALEQLRAQPNGFAAVLMDIQMPVMDGLAATRAIRAELALPDLPVIAVSAAVLAEQQQAARAAGVDEVLTKPIDLEELVAVLRRWGEPLPMAAVPAPAPAPPGDPDAAAPAEFPEIPGLDTRGAAVLLGHDRTFFLSLVRRFAARFGVETRQIRDDLAHGQGSAAARRLHALRGIAGNIGARDLAATALALELGIGAGGPEVAGLLAQFEAQLDALLAALNPWLETPPPGAANPDDAAPLDPAALAALCAALRRRDLAARDLFSQLRPVLTRHHGEAATQALAELIQTLRFDAALARLEADPQQ